ncbi:4-alpha-glucanotransferase [Desulfofalx alkaliphila]|uniref:4-alpha-glucanotransferase n=1 Tax=Desulfofalx alkaliphila TaxID=105483 RepID=UPI0004E1D6A7|nr:4-alpha-glucanotransferase [Desulfofalx alkaliphila]
MTGVRTCGILLHPTSLPSRYGIGDLGANAYKFVDFLHNSKQSIWQILPLNPVGYGESPYQSPSAFAGNPMLISLDKLVEQGYLSAQCISKVPIFNYQQIEFEKVKNFKEYWLKKAYGRFKKMEKPMEYQQFIEMHRPWLGSFAAFMALKEHFKGLAWNCWPQEIALRSETALKYYQNLLDDQIQYHYFLQYLFFSQWEELKDYANKKGIRIVGDLPIYVSFDSSDTWANPDLFDLDEKNNPVTVAGVPPDYFSSTGQLWGNPIYNWEQMVKDDFKWWRKRFETLLKLVDIIRIDHFRGFESYWEVPAGEKTAINGRWVKAPGDKLFLRVREYLEDLPVIAEDLGIITPEVTALKDKYNFPGMRVMQFAFESNDVRQFSPYYHLENEAVYTGTHDNDTMLGWYKGTLKNNPQLIKQISRYLDLGKCANDSDICWRFIEITYQSKANMAVVPLQDILCLDTDARMNYPGTVGGNWRWRFSEGVLNEELEEKLSDLALYYNRIPNSETHKS